MRFSFAYIAVLLSLLSCNKEPIVYQFNGTITNSKTNAKIASVPVEIRQQIFNATATNLNHVFGGEAITDVQGYYELSFERDKVTEFKYIVSQNGYFDLTYFESSDDFVVGEFNTRNFELEPISYIQFKLKNTVPMATDELNLYTYNLKEDCTGCATNGFHTFTGALDTTITYKTTANEYVRFFYTTNTSSLTTNDSLLTIQSDTVIYTINY